jgi:hypothetical protein
VDTLIVTMNALYAAIDGLDAAKEGLFAMKKESFTAKGGAIVRMIGRIAVKRRVCERLRVIFAVMKEAYATLRALDTA